MRRELKPKHVDIITA